MVADILAVNQSHATASSSRTPWSAILGTREDLSGWSILVGRDGKHPAHFTATLLGIDQIGDSFHFEPALKHPVAAGQTGIQKAMFDVARHLLRANEHALDLGIVDRWKVRAAVDIDVVTGAAEERDRGVLQTTFGNTETNLTHDRTSLLPFMAAAGLVSVLVKQETVPS